jgi:uncharacterized cofD-like protein
VQRRGVGGVRAVVLGGGTGSFTVLSALKHYVDHITAVVNMVDDGGSTGQLRDELGVLPPGDVRQALVALSLESRLMRELMNYRFDAGSLEGHSFGNLLLTALEKITGSFDHAVQVSSRILAVRGDVVPVTTQDVRLCLRLPSGEVVRGEHQVAGVRHDAEHRPDLFLEPPARLNPRAATAIAEADLVVMGPGSLYSSLLALALTDGLPEALAATSARKVYVANLMTKPGQTDGFRAHDFVDVVEAVLGPVFDHLVYNTEHPGEDVLRRYAEEGEQVVLADQDAMAGRHWTPVGADLVSDDHDHQRPADPLRRTLIRHDSDRLARLLMRLYFS